MPIRVFHVEDGGPVPPDLAMLRRTGVLK